MGTSLISERGNKAITLVLSLLPGMMLISMILVLLVGVLAVNAVSLRSRNAQYKKQEAELEAQIKEEKKRAKEVEAYEAYVKTDDYVKEIAEEKLGLVDPNEIIFKPAK